MAMIDKGMGILEFDDFWEMVDNIIAHWEANPLTQITCLDINRDFTKQYHCLDTNRSWRIHMNDVRFSAKKNPERFASLAWKAYNARTPEGDEQFLAHLQMPGILEQEEDYKNRRANLTLVKSTDSNET